MSNWISPTVKQLWNYAMHVLHNFFRFNTNTTAFCLGQSSVHLLLLKSSMIKLLCFRRAHFREITAFGQSTLCLTISTTMRRWYKLWFLIKGLLIELFTWQSFLIVQSRHLFVYFHPFYITIQLQYKKHWCCCTCDSNPRYAQAGQLSYDDRSSVVNLTNASQSYLLRRQSGGC